MDGREVAMNAEASSDALEALHRLPKDTGGLIADAIVPVDEARWAKCDGVGGGCRVEARSEALPNREEARRAASSI